MGSHNALDQDGYSSDPCQEARSQANAACEGFFGRLKTEFFYPWDWRRFTAEQFINEVDGYICW